MGDNSRIRIVDCLVLLFHFQMLMFIENSYCLSFDPIRKLADFNHELETQAPALASPSTTIHNRRKSPSLTATPTLVASLAATVSAQPARAPATQSVSHGISTGIKNFDRVFYPTGYGADSTGTNDSFNAITSAISAAVQLHKGELLPKVKDLGGIVIDLSGGNYIISKPLQLPPFIGNLVIRGGTIRASQSFPGNRHLIELWPAKQQETNVSSMNSEELSYSNRTKKGVGIYYEDITFRDILFDSSMRGGGLAIFHSARIRIDHCFFIHFTTQGIIVVAGHETYISSSYFGQRLTTGGDKREKTFSGTGIVLRGNDNSVTDVVVFSAGVGIEIAGQGNMVTGVHCYNKATYWGGIGILVRLPGLSQTRISNCYMDYTSIVLEDPVQVHVTNSFFLGDANIVLHSVHGRISGVNIVDNMFTGGSSKPIVKLKGEFKDIDQVVVDRNNVKGRMTLKSTVGRKTVTESSRKGKWIADFSGILLFPNKINHVQYGFIVKGDLGDGDYPSHAVTNVSENAVTVSASKGVENAVVSVVVDQYNLKGEPVV